MLTRSQETAFLRIIVWYKTKTSKVFRLGGPAGSGKSYLIKLIAEKIGMDDCLLITPTGKASTNLIKAGLTAHTIHSRIYEPIIQKNKVKSESTKDENTSNDEVTKVQEVVTYKLLPPDALDKYKLFIIDEGSMVGEKLLADIMTFGKPILLVGDPNQLTPVNDESVFTDCDYYLTDIVRQSQDSPVIWLSQQILNGSIPLGEFGNSQVRRTEATPDELRYADEVLTDTNASRNKLNNDMRPLYVAAHFYDPLFVVGDKIICRTNQDLKSDLGFTLTNGAQGIITRINQLHKVVPEYDVVMTSTELGNFKFRGTSDASLISRDVPMAKIEYAYAITVHLSQGSEWDNVIYVVSKYPTRSALYTAVTRAKNSVLVTLPKY